MRDGCIHCLRPCCGFFFFFLIITSRRRHTSWSGDWSSDVCSSDLAWGAAQPHVTRPTRLVLGVLVGLIAVGFGVVSHGLHVANSGLDWRDVTGIGYIVGGLLLVAAGIAATAAPRRAPSRTGLGWRGAHAAGWVAGAAGRAAGGGPAVR